VKLFDPSSCRAADRLAAKRGVCPDTLVRNAGHAVAAQIACHAPRKRTLVLCGKGNNGRDGQICAQTLHQVYGFDVCTRFPLQEPVTDDLTSYGVIVDAVFGTGFHGELSAELQHLFSLCNQSEAFRVAVDLPSGVDAGMASASENSFCAHLTVALALPKPCYVSYPARDLCGKVILCDIGIPSSVPQQLTPPFSLLTEEGMRTVLPARQTQAHKGTFGRAVCFCGSPGMSGAAVLAAAGCSRSGCGITLIASCEETRQVVTAALPACLTAPDDLSCADQASAVLAGCGRGQTASTEKLTLDLLKNLRVPLVLDADSINVLAAHIHGQKALQQAACSVLLTPHPAEAARLLGISVADVQRQRMAAALQLANRCNCTVLLKGHASLIASPDGRCAVCPTGNTALSKGGSGDLLAGIAVSFLAQGMPVFEAACAAAFFHGKAAELYTSRASAATADPYALAQCLFEIL